MNKNDIIRLTITGMTAEGSGVGRHEGFAVFVEGAAPGDVIDAHVLKVKKTYGFAKIKKIITPSPDRIESDCPVFARCGGCVYRHISYEAEKRIKQQRVQDAFERIAGESFRINDIIGADETCFYRNKAQYPITRVDGKTLIGFYSQRSHRVVDISSCRIQPEKFSEITEAVRAWADRYDIGAYDEKTGKGLLRHLYLRASEGCREIMACLVTNGSFLPKAGELWEALSPTGVTGLVMNVNREDTNVILGDKCVTLYGKGYITDTLLGTSFDISPLAFYQVNRVQAEKLYLKAAEYAAVAPDTRLLDLYCGVGTIGLTMAGQVKKLTGVEIVPEAIADAKKNAEKNGITNAEFICGDAARAAAELGRRGELPDVIITDPPRKGCDPSLIETISAMAPERVVYVSCDPGTLARDCAAFREKGYVIPQKDGLAAVTPVDMFPGTKHVETVCLLSRQ